jgi:hypothetical protein
VFDIAIPSERAIRLTGDPSIHGCLWFDFSETSHAKMLCAFLESLQAGIRRDDARNIRARKLLFFAFEKQCLVGQEGPSREAGIDNRA